MTAFSKNALIYTVYCTFGKVHTILLSNGIVHEKCIYKISIKLQIFTMDEIEVRVRSIKVSNK